MTISEKENASMHYEYFIRRAFKCDKHKHGANADTFRIYVDSEGKDVKSNIIPSFDTQELNIIENLIVAINRFLIKFKLRENEIVILKELKAKLTNAHEPYEIAIILEKAIEITQRFKEMN